MEIVKSLNINKCYNKVLNGSIVMAKNMRVNEDVSALELDEGFKDILAEAIEKYNEDNNTTLTFDPIVGIIECPKEVVLFTYSHLPSPNGTSTIYRLKEIGDNEVELVKCNTAWKYNGGYRNNTYVNSHINGTYTYNVKGELIVTIGEYTDDNVNVPLRVINLDLDTHSNAVDDYNVAPNVPIANLKLMDITSGNPIASGIYYFFIRYEVVNKEYTNWFPIGKEYYAINDKYTTIFNHQHSSNKGSVTDFFSRKLNDVHSDFYYNFVFKILFENLNFNRCQIGYILQHNNSTVGRIYKSFTISNNELNFVFDAKFKEECSIDELIENPLELYNVHCLTNFENRTYIANYKESEDINNTTLQNAANAITITKSESASIQAFGSKELLNLDELNNATVTYGIKDNRSIGDSEGSEPTEGVIISYTVSNSSGIAVSPSQIPQTLPNYLAELQQASSHYSFPFASRTWYSLNPAQSANNIVPSGLIDNSILLLSTTSMTTFHANNEWGPHSEQYVNVFYLIFPKYSQVSQITVTLSGNLEYFNIDSPMDVTNGEGSSFLNEYFPVINASTIAYTSAGTTIKFTPIVNKYCAIPIICSAINSSISLDSCIIKGINIVSNGQMALSDQNSQQVGGDITIKSPFYFTTSNSNRYLPLYTLLSTYGFVNWLTGENLASDITENTEFELVSHQVQSYVKYLAIDLQSFSENGGITFVEGQFNNGNTSHLVFHKNVSEVSIFINNTNYKADHFVWYTKSGILIDEVYSANTSVQQDVGTFDPEEYYDFYIHYVKSNGAYTNGYKIQSGFVPSNKYGLYKCYPIFSNITIPNPYVGYFISYKQKSTRRLFTGVFTREHINNDKGVIVGKFAYPMKATEVEIGLSSYIGDTLVFENNDGDKSDYATKPINKEACVALIGETANYGKSGFGGGSTDQGYSTSSYNTIGYPGCVVIATQGDNNISVVSNSNGNFGGSRVGVNTINSLDNVRIGTVMNLNSSLIDDDFLIRFSPVLTTSLFNSNNYDCIYPCYITQDIIYDFNQRIRINETTGEPEPIAASTTTFGQITKDKIASTYLTIFYLNKYCKYNLKALSIKKEPTILVTAVESDLNKFNRITYVPTVDSHDLYMLDSSYINNEHKVYKKYLATDTFINHFTKTIRRSNVLSDESVINSLRNFNANQYKVISSNKGNITALVALGTDLLVHTENTLFRISKQAILEADSRSVDITAGDLFSIDPQEVFTANHGYGGLQVENNWCTNEHGYWFYDRDNHKLFNLDNGQLNDIGEPILKYLNSIYPTEVRFNNDFKNHRVLICFTENDLTTSHPVTFSFNALTKSFISIHDFYFGVRCNTKNNVYFLGYLGYRNPATGSNLLNIYKFDGVTNRAYANLSSVAANFPEFVDTSWDANQCAAYIDIIFNNQYPIIRNLDSINYLLGYKEEFDDFDYKLFEDKEKYSGNYIEIYTDSTDSRILDLSQGTEVNTYNDYKHPHYNKGSWQFNYFRNIVAKELTAAQLNEYLTRLDLTESVLPYIINGITDNDNPSEIDQVIRPSDERSLIYGKYIIVRFIFTDTDNKQIRLEDVSANVNSY